MDGPGWAAKLGKEGIYHRMILLVTVMTDNRKRSDGEWGNNGSFSWLECLHRQCRERARLKARVPLCDAKDASERYARGRHTRARLCDLPIPGCTHIYFISADFAAYLII